MNIYEILDVRLLSISLAEINFLSVKNTYSHYRVSKMVG